MLLLLFSCLHGDSLKFIFQTSFWIFHFYHHIVISSFGSKSKDSVVSFECSFLVFSCSCFISTIPFQVSLRTPMIAFFKIPALSTDFPVSLFWLCVYYGRSLLQCLLISPIYSYLWEIYSNTFGSSGVQIAWSSSSMVMQWNYFTKNL